MQELTPQQKKKLLKLAKLADEGNLAIAEHLFEIEEKMEAEIPEIKDIISRVKGDKGDKGDRGEKGDKGERGEKGLDGERGEQGKTGKDSKVPGPKGEKGDRGFPGIDGKDGKDADEEYIINKLEKELPQFGPSFRDGLELLKGDDRLDKKAIKGLDTLDFSLSDLTRKINASLALPPTTSFVNGKRAKNFQFNGTNFSVTYEGDTAVIDFTSAASGVTLAEVSSASTTTVNSLYTMTSTIPVEFRSSDGNTLLYLDETNERIGIGTNAPSDSLSLLGNSATRIGTTWVNTNSSPATSAFLGAYSGNMQMGTVSNHPFYLETNNTVRISIAAAGNIGIGLNSGSAKLHVLATTEQLRLGYDSSNYASFTVTSGGLLNIAPTGTNVGINVASPSSPLHVDGAIRSQRTGTATQNIVLDGGDSSAIYLTASSTTGGQKILRFRNLVTGGAATDATNQFGWDLNTDSSILQIATLSFGSGFKVNRSNTTTQFLSVNGGDSSGIYLTGQSNTSAEKILYISNFTNGTATSANGMSFRVGNAGSPVTAATINYLGNVGIGVSPNHRLDTYLSSSSTGVSTIYGLRDIPSGTISSGSSINGVFGQVTVSGSSTISNVIPTAGRFIAEHDGSSTVGGVYGVYAHARTNAASTGVLANAYSLYAVAPNNNQAGNTITNAYSLYIESPTAGATLNYGLYQTGSANNYFGGSVGIGVTTPSAVLHLKAGTATASTAPLKFTSGTNLTTAEAGAMEFNGTSLFFTRTGTQRETVNTTVTKTDTGDGTGAEGLFQINTFDNTFKVYAEGAWRTLATW